MLIIQAFIDLEAKLLSAKTDLAVYVAPFNDDAVSILHDVNTRSEKAPTALQHLLQSLSGNTISITSSDQSPELPPSYKPLNIVGRLSSGDRAAPTIAFVAHYDTQSAVPGVSPGADSNGSGIVALLELLAVLSKFYDSPSTRPPYNILFIWTAAGKLNYQGTRHWIDEYQKGFDSADYAKSGLSRKGNAVKGECRFTGFEGFSDDRVDLAICIEAIGRKTGGFFMHAGKTPSENSVAAQLLRRLKYCFKSLLILIVRKIFQQHFSKEEYRVGNEKNLFDDSKRLGTREI